MADVSSAWTQVEKSIVLADVVIGVAAWLAVVVAVLALCRRAADGDDAIAAAHHELRRGGDPDSAALAGEPPRAPRRISEQRWVRLPRIRTR